MANEYLPFGTAGGANVITQSEYNALPARLQGFVSGVALSAQLNKTWRQASVVAAMVGQLVTDYSGSDALDDGDVTLLLSKFLIATRRQQPSSISVIGGTVNAITATLAPAITSYTQVLFAPLRVLITGDNTGATTLNLNGLGAKAIVTMRGNALARGDLPSGSIVTVCYNGTAFMLMSIAYSEVPIIGAPILWVRTDGNDANDGSANTAGSALLTITEAILRTQRYFGSSTATIRLGNAGTYTPPGTLGRLSVPVTILGDVASPASYTIAGATAFGNNSLVHVSSGSVILSGVTISNTGTTLASVGASGVGALSIDNIQFTNSVANNSAHVWASDRASIVIGAGVNHVGTAAFGWWAAGGTIVMGASVVANMAATVAFAYSTETGRIARGSGAYTFSGTVSVGARYLANMNGIIQTNGGGANFFPGAGVGTVTTGGQYG